MESQLLREMLSSFKGLPDDISLNMHSKLSTVLQLIDLDCEVASRRQTDIVVVTTHNFYNFNEYVITPLVMIKDVAYASAEASI